MISLPRRFSLRPLLSPMSFLIVDLVRERLGDGEGLAADERLLDVRVGDRVFVVRVHALLREVRERPERRVVSVDV